MGLDADEHVGEVRVRVHAVCLARRDDRVEHGEILAGLAVSDEHEVFAPESHDAQGVFSTVVVDGDSRVVEVARQRTNGSG